ncbi:MFS transporter [Streptomyces sp. NRRL B-24484]|uniref:MFS transporter n=1 Tax=Streptomyces sp. NRRL B-24484 TaxID=1463833 RepID=UPI0004BEAD3A|nr:MFS transporter [Streptomyces sp. NRRL B-24484]
MTEHPAPPTYRSLLGDRRVASVITAVTLGRLAAGMVPFGMIAVFTGRHQLGWAGAAFAAFLIGAALSGPAKGALIDRHGAHRLLVPMALAFAATTAGAAVLALSDSSVLRPAALALTAASAALAPPNSAVLRTVWTEIARSDAENTRLHSLDSVVEEATFVVAPLLTSGIWLVVGAQWAVITGGLSALLGTLWFWRTVHALGADRVLRGTPKPSAPGGGSGGSGGSGERRGVLLSRNGAALLAPMAALGVAMGALSVGYPAWALAHGHVQLAGVLMALDSVGGIVAGLAYGRLPTRDARPWRRYFGAVLVLVAGLAIVAVSTGPAPVVLGSLLVGASLTPMYVIAYLLVGTGFPKDRHTTVNAGIGSAYNLGSGAAALAVGALLGPWRLTPTLLAVAALTLLLGAAALFGRTLPASAAPDAGPDAAPALDPDGGAVVDAAAAGGSGSAAQVEADVR